MSDRIVGGVDESVRVFRSAIVGFDIIEDGKMLGRGFGSRLVVWIGVGVMVTGSRYNLVEVQC